MNKFELLEKKLNIANELIEELDFESIDVQSEVIPVPFEKYEVETLEEINKEVFTIDTLKNDFVLIRNNVMKLINTGQRILESASMIDISDMKPAHLSALSDMQSTLGNNLKLMIALYKEIAEIEKLRLKENKNSSIAPVNNGTVVTNNIVYSGSTEDLLELISKG
jgi:hypothetical protein